jgi:tetratricopeptide (TPR) repeat protein
MELELQYTELSCCEAGESVTLTQEETLEAAIPEYCPEVTRIVDAVGQLCLREYTSRQISGSVLVTVLYTSEEGVGDPADLVGMIDKSLESDPDNVDLWFGRGRVFYKLKNYDETINSFKKVVELKPDLYEGNYYLGLFYTVNEHRDGAEELPQPVGVRCRPERGERRLHGGSALLREGASAQTRRRGYGRLHQVDQLPSARRTGYDGQVQ